MTSPAAIQADYCDLRFIKSRKVCQIVVEIPIEAGGAFVAAFGTPDPSKGVPIALARINPDAKSERKGSKLAQRAGILCAEGAFQKFLTERIGKPYFNVTNAEEAADYVRVKCDINSRAELDHNPEAADKFRALDSEYTAWRVIA